MNALTNEMADLAEQVKEVNHEILIAQRTSSEGALKVGRLLIDAKERCGHGNWLPFLDRALVGERSARNYMSLARSGLTSAVIADLGGIAGTLAFLREWKLPVKGEALAIVSRTAFDEGGDLHAFAVRDVAYVFSPADMPDFYEIVIFREDAVDRTKVPMWGIIHAADNLPVDTIVHWLTTHFSVPIDDWRIERCEARLPKAILGEESA